MEEIWKSIPGYEGYYEVSNIGNVRSVTRTIIKSNGQPQTRIGKIINQTLDQKGYKQLNLHKDGVCKKMKVHRLVAMAFLPNPNNYPIVNHKDENPSNNNVDNLEWCTYQYNNNYGTKIERLVQKQSNNPIIMCDKETHEPIKEFLNMRIATEELGYSPNSKTSICEVLKGRRKSAFGYWWKYKEK